MGNNQDSLNKKKVNKNKSSNKQFIDSYQYLVIENKYAKPKFQAYFNQIKGFGIKLYQFFNNLKNTSYDSYVQIIEILTKYDPDIEINQAAKKIVQQSTIFDRFVIIYFGINIEAYANHTTTEQQRIELIGSYFNIFYENIRIENIRKVYDSLDQEIKDEANTKIFVEGFKKANPNAQKHLIEYYLAKFRKITENMYKLRQNTSKILSNQDWAILSMKVSKITENKPTLLYSLDDHGTSLKSLEYQIVAYSGPWILVLSHYQQDFQGTKKIKYIVGSYQNSLIKDVHTYQGNTDCFLFGITPKIKYISPENGEGQSNFFYLFAMNNDVIKRRRGMGFGGVNFQNFKLWIDQDIEKKSYLRSGGDLTYGHGYLASPSTNKLDIKYLQIWGLGNQENLNDQINYRKQKEQQIMRRRKVDKKELMNGGFAQNILFEKTFGHRDQIQGEVNQQKQNK